MFEILRKQVGTLRRDSIEYTERNHSKCKVKICVVVEYFFNDCSNCLQHVQTNSPTYRFIQCIWLKLWMFYSRGAVECIRVLGSDEHGETLSTKVVQSLLAAYETLQECASVFAELSYREHTAEAHKQCAYFLRSVTPELKQRSTVVTNVIYHNLSYDVKKTAERLEFCLMDCIGDKYICMWTLKNGESLLTLIFHLNYFFFKSYEYRYLYRVLICTGNIR